jgi:tripartite-type tricarboxylate transporter receptor subunit TctC
LKCNGCFKAALFAALLPLGIPAFAQADYPSRPLRMIVPFAPGGASDFVGRIIQPAMADLLKQQVVVDNRGGAAGNIGVEVAVRATPDGYTFLLGNVGTMAINPNYYTKFQYRPLNDLIAITQVVDVPGCIVVHPTLPVKSVAELIAHLKANPGKLNMASSGNGSTIHMSGELFKMMTGTEMTHVPYRGGALALTDMVGGQVQVMFDNIPTAAEFIRSGKLRGIAVTSTERSHVLPELPTVAQYVPGYEASAWYGLGAPKGTPPEIIETLNKAVNAMLADDKAKVRFTEMGATMLPGTAAEFAKLVADETEKWGKVVKFAGAKVT